MSDATENSARFGQVYSLLLVINACGLVTLAALIGWNLLRLIGQVRRRRPGARLTVRMVAMFVVLSVTPVLVVYYFSLQFLHRGIDSWFDVQVEKGLDNALELSRTALGVRMRELLKQTQRIASDLNEIPDPLATSWLDDALQRTDAYEFTLMNDKGRIIAAINADPSRIIPNRPDDAILLQLRQGRDYIGLDPAGERGLQVRVVVGVIPNDASGEARVLQGLFPITERLTLLADSVQAAFADYRELVYLRAPLKKSFTLTLSLVLLLSLFTAVWAAFFSARRVVAPLRDLAEGTQAVADGNYETQLPGSSRDEVGFLVESFNEMTRKLTLARDETRRSQQQLEAQRTYLQAVLAHLSSGVLTLDRKLRLITANDAAQSILGLRFEEDGQQGEELETLAAAHPHLRSLVDAIQSRLRKDQTDWRQEVILFGASGRQVLMCRGSALPAFAARGAGHVIVFDDITALIQAQRNAAWSEVARRLAHEIKNPLTPIQLSAERLRHKYLGKMSVQDAEVLDSLTRTIVQQVEAMKGMVNAFSNYARSPAMHPTSIDLNRLIRDVVELYRSAQAGKGIQTRLDPTLPNVDADPDRLRQVLHNLLKNALEASRQHSGVLALETLCTHEAESGYVEVRVKDQGSGFPPAIIEHAFEPYVTTKREGSGLGLAIVQKIVEEHGGVVWAENNAEGGATVVIRLPVLSPGQDSGEKGSTVARRSLHSGDNGTIEREAV
jgi:nitrogen fixation/metabolism regulation signal transduction histidine kinase